MAYNAMHELPGVMPAALSHLQQQCALQAADVAHWDAHPARSSMPPSLQQGGSQQAGAASQGGAMGAETGPAVQLQRNLPVCSSFGRQIAPWHLQAGWVSVCTMDMCFTTASCMSSKQIPRDVAAMHKTYPDVQGHGQASTAVLHRSHGAVDDCQEGMLLCAGPGCPVHVITVVQPAACSASDHP